MIGTVFHFGFLVGEGKAVLVGMGVCGFVGGGEVFVGGGAVSVAGGDVAVTTTVTGACPAQAVNPTARRMISSLFNWHPPNLMLI